MIKGDLEIGKPKKTLKPKSPSVRLRAVLWLLWEERTGNLDPDKFQAWYEEQVEKVIFAIKNKLKKKK
jgi:hypothetical protein